MKNLDRLFEKAQAEVNDHRGKLAAALGVAAVMPLVAMAINPSGMNNDKTSVSMNNPDHLEEIAHLGDTKLSLAEKMREDSAGHVTIPAAEVLKYAHTTNPDHIPTINPQDNILQVNEHLVGDIPTQR